MDKIVGRPENIYEYEFMIIRKRNDGDYDWIEDCEGPWEAETAYLRYTCDDEENKDKYIISHNLRISYKKRVDK